MDRKSGTVSVRAGEADPESIAMVAIRGWPLMRFAYACVKSKLSGQSQPVLALPSQEEMLQDLSVLKRSEARGISNDAYTVILKHFRDAAVPISPDEWGKVEHQLSDTQFVHLGQQVFYASVPPGPERQVYDSRYARLKEIAARRQTESRSEVRIGPYTEVDEQQFESERKRVIGILSRSVGVADGDVARCLSALEKPFTMPAYRVLEILNQDYKPGDFEKLKQDIRWLSVIARRAENPEIGENRSGPWIAHRAFRVIGDIAQTGLLTRSGENMLGGVCATIIRGLGHYDPVSFLVVVLDLERNHYFTDHPFKRLAAVSETYEKLVQLPRPLDDIVRGTSTTGFDLLAHRGFFTTGSLAGDLKRLRQFRRISEIAGAESFHMADILEQLYNRHYFETDGEDRLARLTEFMTRIRDATHRTEFADVMMTMGIWLAYGEKGIADSRTEDGKARFEERLEKLAEMIESFRDVSVSGGSTHPLRGVLLVILALYENGYFDGPEEFSTLDEVARQLHRVVEIDGPRLDELLDNLYMLAGGIHGARRQQAASPRAFFATGDVKHLADILERVSAVPALAPEILNVVQQWHRRGYLGSGDQSRGKCLKVLEDIGERYGSVSAEIYGALHHLTMQEFFGRGKLDDDLEGIMRFLAAPPEDAVRILPTISQRAEIQGMLKKIYFFVQAQRDLPEDLELTRGDWLLLAFDYQDGQRQHPGEAFFDSQLFDGVRQKARRMAEDGRVHPLDSADEVHVPIRIQVGDPVDEPERLTNGKAIAVSVPDQFGQIDQLQRSLHSLLSPYGSFTAEVTYELTGGDLSFSFPAPRGQGVFNELKGRLRDLTESERLPISFSVPFARSELRRAGLDELWQKIPAERRSLKSISRTYAEELERAIPVLQRMLAVLGVQAPSREEILAAMVDTNLIDAYRIRKGLPPTFVFEGSLFKAYRGALAPQKISVTIDEVEDAVT
ncbi:MAG: hypothetical protein PHN49_12665, partial [Candidatus Omnitrophica bacterium]|nr:hypothetical protein [Candidatus Omnitrophota bacterium]